MQDKNLSGQTKKNIIVVDELGIHASVAGQIMTIVQKALGNIEIMHKGECADAASMLDILSLECSKGSRITIIAENEQDIGILEAIEDIIQNDLKESS